MTNRQHGRTRGALVLGVVGVLSAGLVASLPAAAVAPSHKTFSATVGDGTSSSTTFPIAAGAWAAPLLQFTIANNSAGSQAVPYGSFQLRAPSGISVTGASYGIGAPLNFNSPAVDTSTNTVTITSNGPTGSGIAPGKSLTVIVAGSASPATCPGTWGIEVKQSNDFSGTGNDFSGNNVSTPVSGGTKLSWSTQPSDTEFDVNMTPAPAVSLLDGCGNVVSSFNGNVSVTDTQSPSVLKGGPLTVTAVNGTATLSSVQFTDYALTDRLVATSTDAGLTTCASTDPCTSNQFAIYQLLKACDPTGKQTCNSGTLGGPLGETFASIVADAATTPDVLTVNVKGQNTGTCNGTTAEPPLGEGVDLNVDNRGKTLTLTLPKVYVNQIPNNGTPFMDVCLDVTPNGAAFFDKLHYSNPTLYPNPVQIGLIPDCTVTGNVRPCVVSRKKNAGNEIITANLPAGDPHTSWY